MIPDKRLLILTLAASVLVAGCNSGGSSHTVFTSSGGGNSSGGGGAGGNGGGTGGNDGGGGSFNTNHAPTAQVSAPASVAEGTANVTLDGSGSSDPDAGEHLSYAWQQLPAEGDPVVTINNPDQPFASFTTPPVDADRDLNFHLTVTDSGGLSSSAAFSIRITDGPASSSPPPPPKIRAGVGVVDDTWNVGACSGQYCDTNNDPQDLAAGGEVDPFVAHRLKDRSYGVQSRLTARALVIEGNNGRRIALVKTDNYLAQDMLMRRVGQILDAHGVSGISYPQILYHVTHDHSSPYYATLSAGVWLFEDVYDQRAFEFQARRIAQAIETAAANLRPARMGATTVRHVIYKGNVVRLAVADDGTPAGYPLEYNDHQLTVMRIDDMSNVSEPKPLAVWVNWGEHPESLDGYDLHSADYLAPLERFVQRETGAPLLFSQGDVGSSENTGNAHEIRSDTGDVCGHDDGANHCDFGQGVLRDWDHHGFVQTERNVRFLADDIIRGWEKIGRGDADVKVPMSGDFPVDFVNTWVPGPLSHPYPSVSNCRTQTTLDGNVGVPVAGLPDCYRVGTDSIEPLLPLFGGISQAAAALHAAGLPIPDHYDFIAFGAVEENIRLKLQAFRLGEVLLASCACEAQNDLILNLKSRTDKIQDNIYDGFDWACLLPEHAGEAVCKQQKQYYDPAEFPTAIPGATSDAALMAHLRAEVHNDARGWDAPENILAANSEPTDSTAIWGNFTREELPPALGFALPVGVGHAGDYNGYTVSYREYMNRDSYRKALTSYGPHTADYMVTRLVRMAGSMKGGPALAPEPDDVLGQADNLRETVLATLLGQITSVAYDTWLTVLPNDVGPAQALAQPANITRFAAATFTWRGGSTASDNPIVRVERKVGGNWQNFADMSGEVQTMVHFPQGVQGIAQTYLGQQEWQWTANFEAYDSFPERLGNTPNGSYRFVVDGNMRQDNTTSPYHLESAPFTVSPWNGIAVTGVSRGEAGISFSVPAIAYPRSYVSTFPFIQDNGSNRICDQCTFRPWARAGEFDHATVTIVRGDGGIQNLTASCSVASGAAQCSAPATLADGDSASIRAFDSYGETSPAVSVP